MMAEELSSKIIKFSSQTAGRDKLYRTCQYSSKLLWWCLEQSSKDQDLIRKVKALEKALSTSRKLLRIGKSFDMFTTALKTIHLEDTFLRVTVTLSKLNQAVYLLIDHMLWAHRVGIVAINNERLSNLSARFWLATLLLNLSRDLYELAIILQDAVDLYAKPNKAAANGEVAPLDNGETRVQDITVSTRLNTVVFCLQLHVPILLDLVKNTADLFLPLSSLGYLTIPAGVQGLCGVISSVVGMATVWEAKLKIKP